MDAELLEAVLEMRSEVIDRSEPTDDRENTMPPRRSSAPGDRRRRWPD